MPYKNVIKEYFSSTIYHLYARGVNKMDIFLDDRDYKYFLHLLKKYLTKDYKESIFKYGEKVDIEVNSIYGEVNLLEFCLMRNHFHLLVENITELGITKLMRRVLSNYVNYFNLKYKRQGPLIQGGFRAVPVRDERQLITVGIYIHLNPLKDGVVKDLKNSPYSSFQYYFANKKARWLTVLPIIKESTDYKNMNRYFDQNNSYYSDLVDYNSRL